jgi:alkylation response protein AidB-like acyl-CoA dehydrogenase
MDRGRTTEDRRERTDAVRASAPTFPPLSEHERHPDNAAELLARRCLAMARANYAGMGMETRILIRRDFTFAMKMLRGAMDALIKISGSSGLLDDNPVQRAWRDVHAISSHVVMNWDVPAGNFGRMEFGLGRNEACPAF